MRSSRAADEKKELELSIGELANGGDGVAVVEIEGARRAVFVRGAAPHDRIRASVDLSSRPARARIVEILERGPARVDAACPHAARCGGCDWMHIARISQPDFHGSIVRAALPKKWADARIESHAWGESRRTRARLHVRAERRMVRVGFYEPRSHALVEVDACIALHPALERARTRIAALFEHAHGEAEAEIALGALREPDDMREPVLDIQWRGDLPAIFFARMEAAVSRKEWQGARVLTEGANRAATIGDATPWIRGGDGEALQLAPGGFAQASEHGNIFLAKRVAELAHAAIEKRMQDAIVELYSGAGNFTVLLARLGLVDHEAQTRDGRLGARVVAIESNAAACEAAKKNLKVRSLAARVVNADASTYAIPKNAALVVLDPPRTGAREACEKIAAARARHVLYVSCDPATLGRDLAIFDHAGYALERIETFEMFPDTSHVETLVSLARAKN